MPAPLLSTELMQKLRKASLFMVPFAIYVQIARISRDFVLFVRHVLIWICAKTASGNTEMEMLLHTAVITNFKNLTLQMRNGVKSTAERPGKVNLEWLRQLLDRYRE